MENFNDKMRLMADIQKWNANHINSQICNFQTPGDNILKWKVQESQIENASFFNPQIAEQTNLQTSSFSVLQPQTKAQMIADKANNMRATAAERANIMKVFSQMYNNQDLGNRNIQGRKKEKVGWW